MTIQRVRTGAVFTILGLLAGCGGGSGTPALGGRAGTAGAAGLGGGAGKVGGVGGGLGGTTGAAGAGGTAGEAGIGGASAVGGAAGGSTAVGGGGGRGGAAGSSAAGGAAGVVGGGGMTAGGHAGSSPGGAGGDAGSGAAQKTGIIILQQADGLSDPRPVGSIAIAATGTAIFWSIVTNTNTCLTMTSGECQLLDCRSDTTTSPPPTYYQAGAVSISGLLSPVTLAWGKFTNPNYYAASYTAPLWTASTPATLTVTDSADVPAFTMGLAVPNPISIITPVATFVSQPGFTNSASYAISKAGPLNIAWTGGVDGEVGIDLYSGVRIHCTVAAAKGAVTVPANFMAQLGADGSFAADVSSHADKMVGAWLMRFQALNLNDHGSATFSN